MRLHKVEVLFLIYATVFSCSSIVSGAELTLHKMINRLVRTKRDTDESSSLYSQSPSDIASSIYQSLFEDILYEKPAIDIVIVLDSSKAMGETGFNTAKRTLNNLVRMFPKNKFQDGTIKVSMLRYSVSEDVATIFDFSWEYGHYKEMVRRAVSQVEYRSTEYENHGSIALLWAEAVLANSTRYNNPDTTKVILYASSGQFTDKDLYTTMQHAPIRDAAAYNARMFQNEGYKMFTIVPGTNVDKSTIASISSQPLTNYVIPVVNEDSLARITDSLKNHVRQYRHRANRNSPTL